MTTQTKTQKKVTKSNVFFNFVPESLCHPNVTKAGKPFTNVSFYCDKSATGLASLSVNNGQVLDARKKDGTVVKGFKSILIGRGTGKHKVSIPTGDAKNPYKYVDMTNSEIVDCIETARAAYNKKKAEAEAVAV